MKSNGCNEDGWDLFEEQTRQEFEYYAVRRGYSVLRDSEYSFFYADSRTQEAWEMYHRGHVSGGLEMKRDKQSNQYEISKCNPWIFWTECFFCNKEFRREAGWRFSLQRGGSSVMWSFSCAECSTTKEHLKDNIKKFLGVRPKAPAAPPRKP